MKLSLAILLGLFASADAQSTSISDRAAERSASRAGNLNQEIDIEDELRSQVVPQSLYCGDRTNFTPVTLVPDYNNPMQEVNTIYGFSMFVDNTDRLVSGKIARQGTWEPHFIRLIGHIVKPGMNVLNLGSQTGLEAMVMGKIIGSQGKLFIFEPYSISNAIVNKNVEHNGLKERTTVYRKGASDRVTEASFRIDRANTGGSYILEDKSLLNQVKTKRDSEYEVVEMIPVDQALPADVSLDFALVDVERMEIESLNGMREIINRSPNFVLMVEWQYLYNQKHDTEKTLSVLKFFQEKGYKFYKYVGGNSNTDCSIGKFVEMSIESLLAVTFDDIFFFPSTVPLPTNSP